MNLNHNKHSLQPPKNYESKHPKQKSVTNVVVSINADKLIPLSVVEYSFQDIVRDLGFPEPVAKSQIFVHSFT